MNKLLTILLFTFTFNLPSVSAVVLLDTEYPDPPADPVCPEDTIPAGGSGSGDIASTTGSGHTVKDDAVTAAEEAILDAALEVETNCVNSVAVFLHTARVVEDDCSMTLGKWYCSGTGRYKYICCKSDPSAPPIPRSF